MQQNETSKLLSTILDVQPRTGGGKEGRTPDEVVYDLAGSLLATLPNPIALEKARADLFSTDQRGRVNSLTTVLVQEVDRYNHLLKIIKVFSKKILNSSTFFRLSPYLMSFLSHL